MGFYDDMQSVASDILTQFQQGVVNYVQIVPGNGPVDNPGPSTKNRFVIPSTATGVQFKYIGGLVVASDLQVVAPVDPRYVPDMKGFVEVDGKAYKIVAVKPIPPAGTPVVNVLITRIGG